jgi:LacI family transcriptional regulator
VRADTRRRVQDAAGRLGYQVDPIARALRAGSSGLIGLVLTNLLNSSIQAIAKTVQATGYAEGFDVLIATTEDDAQRELEIVERLRSHRVDGVLVMGTGANTALLNGLNANGFAVVAIIRLPRGVRTPSVVYDDRDAAGQATLHLLDAGHRRLAFIGGPAATRSGRERYAGFAGAMRSRGVAVTEGLVHRGSFTPEFGAAAMERLLNASPAPTGLVVANHEAMSGVLQIVAREGVEVPGSMSLVGIEDAELMRFWHPAITVVDTRPEQLGAAAIARMVRRLRANDATEEVESVLIPAQLVPRGSVGPPK